MGADLGQGLKLLAVGTAGALIARGIGIPAGIMVGALLASGLYRLAGAETGTWRARYGQVGRLLLGTFVGAAFGPDVISPLKAALLPMVVLVAVIIAVGLILGWALAHLTQLDVATALISSVPGGLPGMVAVAEETDADATVVAAIHFSRLTAVLVVVPALMPLLAKTPARSAAATSSIAPVGAGYTAVTLAAGLIAGLLAMRRGVPTGDLVGPMVVIGGANLAGAGLGPLDSRWQQLATLLIGTAVGAQMSRQSLQRLWQAAPSAAAVVVVLIVAGLLLGWGLMQVTPLDPATALLSSMPGGASTMPAIAHDLGGDVRLVAALHLTRQLVILILVPSLLGHLLGSRRRGQIAPQRPAGHR